MNFSHIVLPYVFMSKLHPFDRRGESERSWFQHQALFLHQVNFPFSTSPAKVHSPYYCDSIVWTISFINEISYCINCIAFFSFLWQFKIGQEGNQNYCLYDSDIATGLGVGSFFILVASQAIIMVVTRCLCCGKAMIPSSSRSWAIFLFITSWYVAYISLIEIINICSKLIFCWFHWITAWQTNFTATSDFVWEYVFALYL